MLYTLTPEKMLVWPCALSADQKKFVAAAYKELPVLGRLVGGGSASCPMASREAVLGLAPDMILDVGAVNSRFIQEADKAQQQLRIPYVLFHADFSKLPDSYRKLGAAIGASARAENLAAIIEKTVSNIRHTAASIPAEKRPRIYVARGKDGLLSGLAGSHELITILGAENVVPDAGKGKPITVAAEVLLAWNPDIILVEDPQLFKSLKSHPIWRHLQAVASGRVYRIPGLPSDWLDTPPGVNRLMGLQWLAQICFPDEFNANIREAARQFNKTFYGSDLSEQDLDELFRDAMPSRPS